MRDLVFDYSEYYEDRYEYDKTGDITSMKVTNYQQPTDINKFFSKRGFCPFCKEKIPLVYTKFKKETIGVELIQLINIWECQSCGWWEHFYQFSEEEDQVDRAVTRNWDTLRYAIIKRYNLSDKNVPVETLMMELNKKRDILYNVHPQKLEEIGRAVFSSFYNCDVKHVGRTGDGGIDLIIVQSDDPILVQVKNRKNPQHIEIVKPIREFVGAMYINNAKKGIYLSTAKDYSKGAKATVKKLLDERKFEYFELVNFEDFVNMLDIVKKDDLKPWMKLVKSYGFE